MKLPAFLGVTTIANKYSYGDDTLDTLNVAGFLVFFVGLLVTIPLSLLVLIDVYRQLSPATTSSQSLQVQPAIKSRLTRSNA